MEIEAAAGPLALIFATNSALLTKAFDGVEDDQLWQRPSRENNPMLWIAGHMAGTRALMLNVLGSLFDTGWGTLFARGAVVGEEATYPRKSEILQVHGQIADRIQAVLRGMTASDLAREAPPGPRPPSVRTVGELIGFFALHDSYHLGQIGYIRKSLGLTNLVG